MYNINIFPISYRTFLSCCLTNLRRTDLKGPQLHLKIIKFQFHIANLHCKERTWILIYLKTSSTCCPYSRRAGGLMVNELDSDLVVQTKLMPGVTLQWLVSTEDSKYSQSLHSSETGDSHWPDVSHAACMQTFYSGQKQ